MHLRMRMSMQDAIFHFNFLSCVKALNGFASNAFYLQPLKQPRKDCWYQSKPMGYNLLSQVLKKLCDMAGAKGYYTNHSLRRTCATRLYQNGTDEQ